MTSDPVSHTDRGRKGDSAFIEQTPDLRHALRDMGVTGSAGETAGRPRRNLFFLVIIAGFSVAMTLLYAGSRSGVLPVGGGYASLIERLLLGAAIIAAVVALIKLLEDFLILRVEERAARFNLQRIVRLVAGIGLGLVAMSLIFADWYTALASLGLMSLILGFALQTPITSFIGWIYILVRTPYRVGDRIRIGEATGDVIDVGYLDTTLWEFGGEYLSTDHPSGRIIKFPNSNVLNAAVYNYSWPIFPYVWNEVKFHIAYGSDLEFVSQVMEEVAADEIGAEMSERVRQYRGLLSSTPVDEIQVQERPVVLFRVSDNTWLEAIVRYLVDPKQAGPVKTALIRKMLVRLTAEQDRVMFPRSDNR